MIGFVLPFDWVVKVGGAFVSIVAGVKVLGGLGVETEVADVVIKDKVSVVLGNMFVEVEDVENIVVLMAGTVIFVVLEAEFLSVVIIVE